jgi:hypothetical protein
MADYTVQIIGARGVVREGAGVFSACEVALGGRVVRDLWENKDAPPAGVATPSVWKIEIVDHQGLPFDGSGAPIIDDDGRYLFECVDGGQTSATDLVPNLIAWATALEAAENA